MQPRAGDKPGRRRESAPVLRRGESRRPGNAPGCTDAPRRGARRRRIVRRLDGPRRRCAAGPGVARLREPVPPWRKASRGLGHCPAPRCRDTGGAIPRVPDKAVDRRWNTQVVAAASSRQGENVAFGFSQQCGSGCPLRHRIAHYNLPSEPCGCPPALAASARVHPRGMRLPCVARSSRSGRGGFPIELGAASPTCAIAERSMAADDRIRKTKHRSCPTCPVPPPKPAPCPSRGPSALRVGARVRREARPWPERPMRVMGRLLAPRAIKGSRHGKVIVGGIG